jgi:hypothetical protein
MYPDLPVHYLNYGPTVATYLGVNGLGAIVMEREGDLD